MAHAIVHVCKWPHGTRQRYQCASCKCRCPDCRLGNTNYQRGYRHGWQYVTTPGGLTYRQLQLPTTIRR